MISSFCAPMNLLSDLQIDPTLAFGIPGGPEWIVILVIGLLIFGRRLPEVGRSVGKSIVEFKKGIKGIEDEIEEETTKSKQPTELHDDSAESARSAMYEPTSSQSQQES